MKDLKKLRDLSNLTQTQLAQLSGVDRATVSLAESNQIQLRTEQEDALREVLFQAIRKRAEAYKPYLELTPGGAR